MFFGPQQEIQIRFSRSTTSIMVNKEALA